MVQTKDRPHALLHALAVALLRFGVAQRALNVFERRLDRVKAFGRVLASRANL